MRSVELFTGCGGLALGLSRAGFQALRMSEWDGHSIENVLHNKGRGIEHVKNWKIEHEDVRSVDWSKYSGVELVAGGPPCQPFSIGGRHRGHADARDMWPEAVRAVREIEPSAFLFENVRGIAREAFASYLRWVVTSLSLPQIEAIKGEGRAAHLRRLEAEQKKALYKVAVYKVNAADFGAAQKRHRVLFIGYHIGLGLSPPELLPTHSRERLLWDQWISGAYWKKHNMRAPRSGPEKTDLSTVRHFDRTDQPPDGDPWVTVRDVLAGLGKPGARDSISNHVLQKGARSYPGHTGSPLDAPAKALKAGVHGVPGGENMMALPDGSVRYFTVREAARLQGLPDDYEFVGSWSENMRQCGNAVPVPLAEFAGIKIGESLRKDGKASKARAA